MSIEPLNQRIQQLQRLLEVGRNLSAMLDLEPLLQSIIDVAAELTFSQEASILFYDAQQDNLQFVAAPWFKRDQMSRIRVPLDSSIAGHAFSSGEPILVSNAKDDPRIYREVDKSAEFETESILAVPMVFKGKPTGVLSAVNKMGNCTYAEEDIRILETLASQAAVAIENANYLNEAQRAYQELAELDRMKSDFIAITSHELRTPLGLILGHATFIHDIVPEELKPQMDVIVKSSLRLKDIVEDLSKVNSFQTGESRIRRELMNLNVIVKDVTDSLKTQADEKQIKLEMALSPPPIMLNGDSEKISIALSHLIRNAVSFTDPGGSITVRTEGLPGYAKVEVTDTGIGIPEKDLIRIFDRFYQVEEHMTRRHGGMGLGLSVAKMMVEMHNGRLSVHSEEGEGSTFAILLPLGEGEEIENGGLGMGRVDS
ncbi:MAG: ATP-binding protein [Anaerolineales bacterium]|jgi:signal transduction histidine kinase